MNYKDLINRFQPKTQADIIQKQNILSFLSLTGEEALLRSSAIAHMTATALVFNENRDKILMIHHNIFNTWACVGGHADGNPDLLQLAFQELAEETGIEAAYAITDEIQSLDILTVQAHMKNGLPVPNHLHLNATFALEASDKTPYRIKADENSAVRWIPIVAMGNYCKEDEFVAIYKKIINHVRTL